MHDVYAPGTDTEAGMGHPSRRRQKGQTLVVVAVLLVVLIGFLGLVIDGGNVYAQRRQMQNAADAAALAGARALALDESVDEAVAKYASDNGADGWDPPTVTERTVSVVVTKAVTTYFVRVLGITSVSVGARATARVFPLDEASCGVMPITVENLPEFLTYQPGQEFTIWDANPGQDKKECLKQATGSFDIPPAHHGWISLDPSEDCNSAGAGEEACWECVENKKGCPRRLIAVGDWIPGRTGVVGSAAKAMECNTGETVLLPLYDKVCNCKAEEPTPTPVQPSPTPKKNETVTPEPTAVPPCLSDVDCSSGCGLFYHIVGFASVTVEEVGWGKGEAASGCKFFRVHWEKLVTSPDCAQSGPTDPTNAWTVRLIE